MRRYNANKDVVEVRAVRGDLIVRVFPNGTLEIESQRGTSIKIVDIDYSAGERTKSMAPEGTTHEIYAYRIMGKDLEPLNADVYSVHVGPRGIILDGPARERAKKLPENGPKRRGDR